jgi:hypothetical protein
MNQGEPHCLTLHAPTFDFWLEITRSTKKFDSEIHPNYKFLEIPTLLQAKMAHTETQIGHHQYQMAQIDQSCCSLMFHIAFIKMFLLADSNRYYVNSNKFLIGSKDLYPL